VCEILVKFPKIKFHENPFSKLLHAFRWTDKAVLIDTARDVDVPQTEGGLDPALITLTNITLMYKRCYPKVLDSL
jgi:hypothetical protein